MAIRRFRYRMHHNWITSARVGQWQPFFLQEVTPGDTWHGLSKGLMRVAPMDLPAFVAFSVDLHMFFVPWRLVFPEFEEIITGEDRVTAFPTISRVTGTGNLNLMSAMGCGPGNGVQALNISALPIRAYNLVWNEFLRDQSFTAITNLDQTTVQSAYHKPSSYITRGRTEIQQSTEVTVDTSGATLGVTEIRDAFHRQKFAERRSQFGDRYTDYLRAMGLSVPDSRLDRPEHVAAGKGMIGVSEVVATATSATENTGDYRGHGIGGISMRFRKRLFVEHGCLLGIFAVRPRFTMRHKVHKHFLLNDREDYFQQELARDTQVPVTTLEIDSKTAVPTNTILFNRRDDWLRTAEDVVASDMQDDTYQQWHGGRDFSGTVPTFASVIRSSGYYDYLFQDQSTTVPHFFCYFDHNISKRSMVPRAAT